MKKIIILLIMISLVGCTNKNEIICTKKFDQSGVIFTQKIIGILENNKIKQVKTTLDFANKNEALSYCEALDNYNLYLTNKIDYKCDNKKITIENYEVLNETDTSIIDITKEDFVNYFKEDNFACK